MRHGPIRLRLEARAFLGIENSQRDQVSYGSKTGSANKTCRLKSYLAAAAATAEAGSPSAKRPSILDVIQQAKRQQERDDAPGGAQVASSGSRIGE